MNRLLLKGINIFIAIVFIAFIKGHGQDAHFSQYYSSGLYLNPAMAGADPNITFSSNYRTQWRSIVLPYVTSQLSMIYPIYNSNEQHLGGVGASLFNDRAGDGNLKTTGFSINGAYNLPLEKHRRQFISFGVQLGFIQKSIDYTNLHWGEQFNPFMGFDANGPNPSVGINTGRTYPDVSAGFFYFFNPQRDLSYSLISAYIGASAYHINKPNESLYNAWVSKLPVLYKGHAGLSVNVGKHIGISPNALFMMQYDRMHVNSGLYVSYFTNNKSKNLTPDELTIGAWYRLGDSFIFSTGFGNDYYTLGFSYDLNTSSLRYNTMGRGAYEISMILHVLKKRKVKRYYTPRI
ncbi:MAG TPA: PorP/SprF family type IX secretion system membrane protein [Cytophagaceae bacterium]